MYWPHLSVQASDSSRPESTLSVALQWWATSHYFSAARLFQQGLSRELPRHRAEACVTQLQLQLHCLFIYVRLSAATSTLLSSSLMKSHCQSWVKLLKSLLTWAHHLFLLKVCSPLQGLSPTGKNQALDPRNWTKLCSFMITFHWQLMDCK